MVMVMVAMLKLFFAQENLHFQGLIVTFHLVTWQKMLFEIKKVGNDFSLLSFSKTKKLITGKLLHFDIPVSCIVA